MKYILVILITMSAMGEETKTIEMRIPQEDREECLKSAKTFKFSLPIPMVTLSTETRCEPRLENEEPELNMESQRTVLLRRRPHRTSDGYVELVRTDDGWKIAKRRSQLIFRRNPDELVTLEKWSKAAGKAT